MRKKVLFIDIAAIGDGRSRGETKQALARAAAFFPQAYRREYLRVESFFPENLVSGKAKGADIAFVIAPSGQDPRLARLSSILARVGLPLALIAPAGEEAPCVAFRLLDDSTEAIAAFADDFLLGAPLSVYASSHAPRAEGLNAASDAELGATRRKGWVSTISSFALAAGRGARSYTRQRGRRGSNGRGTTLVLE
jgi:hypothetical protein